MDVDPTEASIRARESAFDRLNELTAWIAVGAVAALGVFAVIAAQTIPGKASSNPSTANTTTRSSTSTSTSFRHDDEGDSSTISASSGPPLVVTGGSH